MQPTPALRALLGCAPSAVTAEGVHALIAGDAVESELLDFKRTAEDIKDLSKSLAGFANSVGGLIVLGVEELSDGFVARPIDIGPRTEERLRQALSGALHPFASYGIHFVEDGPGKGFALVHVPPSPDSPHAVYHAGDAASVRYPVRDGNHTRYMREPEIAVRYQDRFYRRRTVSESLTELWDSGRESVGGSQPASWLLVAGVPAVSGVWPLNRNSTSAAFDFVRDFQNEGHGVYPLAGAGAARIGRGYVQIPVGSGAFARLYSNGSSLVAACLAPMPESHPRQGAETLNILDHELEAWLVTLLSLGANFTYRVAHASGGWNLRAGLVVAPPREPSSKDDPESLEYSRLPSVQLVRADPFAGWTPVNIRRPISWPTPVDLELPETVSLVGADLVSAGAFVTRDIISEFGEVEPLLLRERGEVDLSAAPDRLRSSLQRWMTMHDIAEPTRI